MHDIQLMWDNQLVNNSGFDTSVQIRNYLQLVNILEDAVLVVKKDKAEESKRSDASGQLYNILLMYVQKLKL